MLDFILVLVVISLVTFTYLVRRSLSNGRPPLPPGPSILSLINEAFRALSSNEGNTYSRWAHKYGDIVYLPIFNKRIIIVNSAQMAIDMQESKGSIYSERDVAAMMKLVGWTEAMTFGNTGAFFRQQRGYLHRLFGTHAALSGQHSIIEGESHRLLRQLLSSPDDLANCIRHFVGSIVLKISYGYTTREQDDPFIHNADEALRELSCAIGLGQFPWMVDIFPSLEKLPNWFPGTNFKKLAKKWSDHREEVTNVPFQLVKEQVMAGTANPSFTSTILGDKDLSQEDERAIKIAAMTIYLAGSDTTVSTLRGFFLAMALNPEVFREAREEIDAVVGTQRLPTISDKTNLPYINALVHELFRWIVVIPNGIPHKTTQDDVHAGYFIPKGSVILSNIHDPRLYKDPERFLPERFLGENPERDPRDMAFGFGRRYCPGRLLAEDTVFAACAMSIAIFDIQKKVKNGVMVEPVRRMVPGFVSHLEPYEVDVKPRSAHAASLIRATAQA